MYYSHNKDQCNKTMNTDKYKHLTFLTKYSKREIRINSKSFLQEVE